jgi:hypothetical protein
VVAGFGVVPGVFGAPGVVPPGPPVLVLPGEPGVPFAPSVPGPEPVVEVGEVGEVGEPGEVGEGGEAGLIPGAAAARTPVPPLAHAVAVTPIAPRTATAARVCLRVGNRDNNGRIIRQSFTERPPVP